MEFEEILNGIYLLKTPFSIVWTGVVLVRGEKNFLIDSGAAEPEKYILPALQKMGMDMGKIDYLLHTHCHGDHIAGHYDLVHKYGLKTAALRGTESCLADPAANAIRIRSRFPEHSPAPQSWLRGVGADVLLEEGEVLAGRLKPIATPGHEKDCVCWYDIPTKTIICGDSLQGNGTLTQGIALYQSLKEYRASMRKLLAMTQRTGEETKEISRIENMICGHEYEGLGSVILGREKAEAALMRCLEFTDIYEEKLNAYIQDGEKDMVSMTERLLRDVGCAVPDKLFLALYTVEQHLKERSTL